MTHSSRKSGDTSDTPPITIRLKAFTMSRPIKYICFSIKYVDYRLKSKITLMEEPSESTLHPVTFLLKITNNTKLHSKNKRKAWKNISNYSRQLQNLLRPHVVSNIQIFGYFHRFLWTKLQKVIIP